MESESTTVLIFFSLRDDRIAEGVREITQLVETVTRAESDCLGIEIMQNLDEPAKLTLIETWTSREAYEGPHMQTAHIQEFIGRSSDFLAGPPDISFWSQVHTQ